MLKKIFFFVKWFYLFFLEFSLFFEIRIFFNVALLKFNDFYAL